MSWAMVFSRALNGMDAPLVEVEAHLSNGLPAFNIVGLPDTEVKESRDRVRSAITQSGFDFPAKKITVNLAPADLPKESGRFDLPIAISILAASGQVNQSDLPSYEFAGELGLSGQIRPIRGTIAMAWAGSKSNRTFIFPESNALQAALIKQSRVIGVNSLTAIAAHLNRLQILQPLEQKSAKQHIKSSQQGSSNQLDLSDIRGQHTARFALELCAAGGHNLLFIGPPGTGKSMLAQRLPSILPDLTDDELVDVWALQSLLRQEQQHFSHSRPFRSPHHSASAVALVGGGSDPKPGEISLANHGVLFLDELPEFDRKVLEVLREPLENGEIHIARANRQVVYPAQFQFIAAMNPCPCGYLGHPTKPCRCTLESTLRYRQKISGPLLDRIDLIVEVAPIPADDLVNRTTGESSSVIRHRVIQCRERQLNRQGKPNARLSSSELEKIAHIQDAAKKTLAQAIQKLSLSTRSFHRILRVARTLADIDDQKEVTPAHVMRAMGFRIDM